jgi:hypothetical protein
MDSPNLLYYLIFAEIIALLPIVRCTYIRRYLYLYLIYLELPHEVRHRLISVKLAAGDNHSELNAARCISFSLSEDREKGASSAKGAKSRPVYL